MKRCILLLSVVGCLGCAHGQVTDGVTSLGIGNASQAQNNQIQSAVNSYLAANPPTVFIPTGTPTSNTAGTDGQTMMDDLYLYTYLHGTWKKTQRLNLP